MKLENEIKQTKPIDIRVKALLEILFTASYINNKHSKYLQPYKISPQQYNILRILRGVYPNQLNVMTIKSRMVEKTPNTTRMVDKLFDNGYVDRERSEKDRRMVFVKITDKGLDIMSKIDEIHPDFLKFTYNLDNDETKSIIELLEKLRE